MFATTKMAGMCFAFPDVCKTPAPPAPSPIPIPYPNLAQCPMGMAPTCAKKVKIMNQPAMMVKSKIPRTNGDEPGVAGGVVSSTFGDQCVWGMGSNKVKIEGSPAVTFLKPTKHNGSNPNAPGGSQIVPSQPQVLILG